MMDLSTLSAQELEELVKKASEMAEHKRAAEKSELRTKVLNMIQEAGFKFSDIFPDKQEAEEVMALSKKVLPIKYRDPANPNNTWKGRGRYPTWLEEALAAGRKLEEFLL